MTGCPPVNHTMWGRGFLSPLVHLKPKSLLKHSLVSLRSAPMDPVVSCLIIKRKWDSSSRPFWLRLIRLRTYGFIINKASWKWKEHSRNTSWHPVCKSETPFGSLQSSCWSVSDGTLLLLLIFQCGLVNLLRRLLFLHSKITQTFL